MCLEIIIKKSRGYYLTFMPEAKAYTDAPSSLAVLIKQRRRWNNGALFGTYNVIRFTHHILSCRRTTHGAKYKIPMAFFMMYYIMNFLLSFFTVGAMYASITIFL